MLSPEIFNFPAPESSFNLDKFEEKVPLNNKTITNFYFNHMVTVVIPDSLRLPANLTEQLVQDCDYYKISNLNLGDLIDIKFLSSFIRSGNLTVLSINSRIDCDNSIAITSSGQLILTVDRDTYQSLGIEGKLSHFVSKIKSQYTITVDLTDGKLLSNKSKLNKLKLKLESLEKFTVILTWEPPDEEICPSSIAKHFNDLGYTVKVCTPSFNSHTVYTVNVPLVKFDKTDKNDILDFVEWLGMVVFEGDVRTNDPENYVNSYVTPEPNIALGQVKCLRWKGLFSVATIQDIIKEFETYNANMEKPWISIYIQGFSDAPLIWKDEENHFFTNGDNGYFIIFEKSGGIICTQKCSRKRYK